MNIKTRLKIWRGRALLGWLGSLWLTHSYCNFAGLDRVYWFVMVILVRRTDLFDNIYYLEVNTDVARAGASPLDHYVRYGDWEGRAPMPLFDPVYYRSQLKGRLKEINALLHYAWIGRYLNLSPHTWFDVHYYVQNNIDVVQAGVDPLLHFLKYGALEGRSPCPQFNNSWYLHEYVDVAQARMNPLVHYLMYGAQEGRAAAPDHGKTIEFKPDRDNYPALVLMNLDSAVTFEPRAENNIARIDVIIPVYKGRTETLRCLYSVLTAECKTEFNLIVIDDASPDVELVKVLQQLASQGLFTLLTNKQNRGFVYSVNRGMACHDDKDIVLLNSDTEVYPGWLDRLHTAALRNERTGTVTPLSNNATICSYPHFLHDNQFPIEMQHAELDALIMDVNKSMEVEAPTGVGFCMYIKRACLNEIGLFDEKAFGRGYGEENDFCQKAIKNGWRNIIAADVYVHHAGAASFLTEKPLRVQNALNVLARRHPQYQEDVNEFIQADPLLKFRQRIDWARLLRVRREKNILVISHSRGGGTERFINEYMQPHMQQNHAVFFLRPLAGRPECLVLSHSGLRSLPNLESYQQSSPDVLLAALKELRISEIHIHSLIDFHPEFDGLIQKLANALNVPLEIYLHDYAVICPRINLVDENGRYCGEPEKAACNRCLVQRGSEFNVRDIKTWRDRHLQLLQRASRIQVPDQDVATRLLRYFPDIKIEIQPHELIEAQKTVFHYPGISHSHKLRIVVIGGISQIKGFDVLLACAQNAKADKLPLEFILMGYSMNNYLLQTQGVHVTGRYQEQDALSILLNLHPHVVWLPSLWPETYSYTLSLAFKCGVPIAAFDIGAIGARLHRAGQTDLLMPLDMTSNIKGINSVFMNYRNDAGRLYGTA